jgi:DNA-binding HxlR family transcriptional regulator
MNLFTFVQSCILQQSYTISQKIMTTKKLIDDTETCPAQGLLKMISGKWKPEIFRLAVESPLRFSGLLRQIEGSNKQSLSVALKELEEVGLLEKVIIKEKPLHIEYYLTDKGKSLVPVLKQLEILG